MVHHHAQTERNEQFNNVNKSETIARMFSPLNPSEFRVDFARLHVQFSQTLFLVPIIKNEKTRRHFLRLPNMILYSPLRTFSIIQSNFQSTYTTNNHLLVLQQCLIYRDK